MSEFLALNFDVSSSPELKVKPLAEAPCCSGWGIGWYPKDDYSSVIIKEPTQSNNNEINQAITEWDNFYSTTFMCKVRGIARIYTMHDMQPFNWSYAGKDWMFLHNGEISKNKLTPMHDDKSGFLSPKGNSDSELLFCYLLGKIHSNNARSLSELTPSTLLSWLRELDEFATIDIILSDHESIAVYHSRNSQKNLFYTRFLPPLGTTVLEMPTMNISIPGHKDRNNTLLLFNSESIEGLEQQRMNPGELILARRGKIIWTSDSQQVSDVPLSHVASNPKTRTRNTISKNTVLNLKSITEDIDGNKLEYKTYNILHKTVYNYHKFVRHSSHNIRLIPVDDWLQEVVHSEVKLSVDSELINYEDVFGNHNIYCNIYQPYTSLEIVCQSKVKVYALGNATYSEFIRRTSLPLVWMPWQRQMMSPYLLPPELPENQLNALTDYAISFCERNDYNVIETLKDINISIHTDYAYQQGVTNVGTTPFETYQNREGVCQDFTNLLICLAQLLGIPARYRMGYIFTGGGYENKEQSDATHAWAEVYVPKIGWVGLDPTNGTVVRQDHIKVSCGRNSKDATPTSGAILNGGGEETLSIEVKVTMD